MLERFGVTDDERATIVSYVKDVVVESYKNGIEQGKREAIEDNQPTFKRKTAERREE